MHGKAQGALARNIKGTIAHLSIGEVVRRGRYGRVQRSWHPYTVALTGLPRAEALVPVLTCHPRSGFDALEGVEDALLHRGQTRIELESQAFDERYELWVSDEHDANWLRQLFGPSFIVWLTESPPPEFGFDYGGGRLCAFLEKHRDDPAELDALREGLVGVTRAFREQIVEKLGRVKRPPAG